MAGYIENVLIGIDQFANALLGGDPGDTISYNTAVARRRGKRWGCVLCAILDRIVTDHCERTRMRTEADWQARAALAAKGEDPL